MKTYRIELLNRDSFTLEIAEDRLSIGEIKFRNTKQAVVLA
ncbi:MAG: hypothetical protein RLZZ574_544 [Cyanobacteriota bacterium]|jgi:hypothetical protein